MNVIIYLRKSRSDDASLTVQEVLQKHENILQEYCEKTYGAKLQEEKIYREVVSGETIADRPVFREVLEIVTNENIDGVLVVEPQRLSRGDLMDCGTVCRIFKYTNTKVITPQRTYDLTDKYDYKFFEMELRQGNEYLEYVRAILKRGKEANIKKGQYIYSVPPFGYDKTVIDKQKTLIPNKDSPTVKLIFDLAAKGMSPGAICRELDRKGIKPANTDYWRRNSICAILGNVHYIGKVKYGANPIQRTVTADGNVAKYRGSVKPEIYDGIHEPIIDVETFEKVQELRGTYSRKQTDKQFISPFASLVKCGICGYAVTHNKYGGNGDRMACRHQSHCGNRSIKYDDFLDCVITALKAQISDFDIEISDDIDNKENVAVNAITSDLKALEKRQLKLYDLLESGTYSEDVFTKRNNALAEEREKLEKALEQEKEKATNRKAMEAYTVNLHSVIDKLRDEHIKPEDKNFLLKGILTKIEYTRIGDHVDLQLYY